MLDTRETYTKSNRHRDTSSAGRSWRLNGWRWSAALVGVGAFAFAMAALVSWLLPFFPRVHDEFSNLLAADTLLHGRLANPTPEVWQPFQSFHIIVEPAYASKYPLGLAMLIAAGWFLFGVPVAGCWLAAAICTTSITWMLAGVTSRRWAVLGGMLIACHPPLQLAWSQNLMSGWLTAAGSALLAGGVFRLRRRHSHLAAGVCGIGVALLALTRPFEGLVATIALSLVCWGLWHNRGLLEKVWAIARALPAASLPIAAALTLVCMQNLAVSGRIARMAYQLHEQQYGVAPLFVFGHQQSPAMEASGDLPETMRAFHYGWALDSFRVRAGVVGWLKGVMEAVLTLWDVRMLLTVLPLVTIGWWGRFRLTRWLGVAIALQVLLSATVCWVFLHYLSPLIPWLVVPAVLGLRRIFRLFANANVIGVGQPLRFVGVMLVAQCVLLIAHAMRAADDPKVTWAKRRVAIVRELEQQPGRHLVLVRYSADHNVHQEWVYNLANLEQAKVLWARGERRDWNESMFAKYKSTHSIWELEPDDIAARPKLFSTAE